MKADAMIAEKQLTDPRPGYYYAISINGGCLVRLRGPFVNDHAGALAVVDDARRDLCLVNPWAAFHTYGAWRSEADAGPGFLDDEDARAPHDVELRCTSCRRKKLTAAERFDPACSCGGTLTIVVEHDHALTHAEAVALGYGIRSVPGSERGGSTP